jgi:hypothetical protein
VSMTCTTPDCQRDTSLYLCTACIVELDGLLKDVPALIGRLDEVRAGTAVVRTAGGSIGGHAGSKPPGSLDAMMLQAWLAQLPERAHVAAHDYPNAGEWLYMARIWVPQARQLAWGFEEPEIDHDANREKLRAAAPPMPTKELLPWLRKNARIAITSMDIRNWARRGKLVPVERYPQPTYHPHEVLNAWHDTRAGK